WPRRLHFHSDWTTAWSEKRWGDNPAVFQCSGFGLRARAPGEYLAAQERSRDTGIEGRQNRWGTAPPPLTDAGLTVTQPMKGYSIGKQLQWLNEEKQSRNSLPPGFRTVARPSTYLFPSSSEKTW